MPKRMVLSHHQHLQIDKNHQEAARKARLSYISGKKDGIVRIKKGKGYSYSYKGKAIRNDSILNRIKKLAIPPSWKNVWISPLEHGHIQATGTDLNGRKQYRYHLSWNELRNETKFHRLLEFGKSLPLLRKRTSSDLRSSELSAAKVLATAVRLMEETCIRVGNSGYEKLYGSYGLTTLKDKHVEIQQHKAVFSFKGKKGIVHEITLKNRELAKIVKQCREIPGQELFQYYKEDGTRGSIDSGMVNKYIKDATGNDFSAKDFRTWAGSLQAIQCFCSTDEPINGTDIKQNIIQVLDQVSVRLGNTRNICKKYYVHPVLIRLYEEKKLLPYLKNLKSPKSITKRGLSSTEKLLLKVLKLHN